MCDELAELGNEQITLSGGELFLRRDWDRIAARLKSNGIEVSLITNGLLLEKNLPKIEKLLPLNVVAISLDGTRGTHNRIRGMPQSYDRVISGLDALKEMRAVTAAITSVSRLNLGELQQIYEALIQARVDGWQLQLIIGEGRMQSNADLPEPSAIQTISDFIVSKKREGLMEIMAGDNLGYCMPDDEAMRGLPWRGCFAGVLVVGIEADGNVKGCLSIRPDLLEGNPFSEGNLREKSLRDIWEDPRAFAYNRRFDPRLAKGYCRTCPHLIECRCGCTATAYAIHETKYENRYCMFRCAHTKAPSRTAPPQAKAPRGRARRR